MRHVAQAPPSDPLFRTRSPEEAIHLCATAFYPHRLSLLGPSNSFGLTLRVTQMGPITLGDITYDSDVALSFNEPRATYHVNVPLKGFVKSRHRGQQLTSTPTVATNYRPDAEVTVTRWPGGSRRLAVSIEQLAVDRALEILVDGPLDSPIAFDAALPVNAGAAQDWVRLVLMVRRQLDHPDSLIRNPLVWDPLVESLIHGLLLAADHPYRQVLAARAGPGRPQLWRGTPMPCSRKHFRSTDPHPRNRRNG
jgi:AraC-binding-like domain